MIWMQRYYLIAYRVLEREINNYFNRYSQYLMNSINSSQRALSLHSKNTKYLNNTSLLTYIPSTANSQSNNKVSLTNIFTIVKINFPLQYQNYLNNAGMLQQSLGEENFQEHFNRILKQIKQEAGQKIKKLQVQVSSLEMQLNLVRESRNAGEEKTKKLQRQLSEINERLKGKQLDTFGKNQEIFQSKNKIEELQKQLLKQSLKRKQLCKQHQEYKRKMERQINKYQDVKQKFLNQKQWNESYLIQMQRKLEVIKRQNCQYQNINKKLSYQNDILEEKNYELNQKLDQLFIQSQNFKKISHQLMINKCPNCDGITPRSKVSYQQPLSNRSNPNFGNLLNSKSKKVLQSHIFEDTFNMRSRKNSQANRPPASTQQLLAEVKQLRENQSILLDKLSERDQYIQSLSVSNNSLIS